MTAILRPLLIVCAGLASDGSGPVSEYLIRCDVNARGGMGEAWWTPDKTKAMRFPTLSHAAAYWRRQSTALPFRGDGRANRPLTAYSVTFETFETEPSTQGD